MSNIFLRLHCPNCNKNISDTDKLCPHCGINLDAPLEEAELEALAQPFLEKAKKALQNNGDLGNALVNCNQAIEYIPESANAHNLRGLILDAMGKTEQSTLTYQEALRLNPDFAEAKENLADAQAEYQNSPKQGIKDNMTKRKAILLAIFTAWPFLYMIAAVCIAFLIFPMNDYGGNFYGNLPPSMVSTFFRVFIPIHIATMVEMFVLLIYYIVHLVNTTEVAANRKVLWAVILLLGYILLMPVYWYLYIWKPLQSDILTIQ